MIGLRVVEDGKVLELTVAWPHSIRNVTLMRKNWLRPDASDGFTTY